jgi:Zn-dependent membrane protease YugP
VLFLGPAFHDPTYLAIMVIGMGLVFLPQLWVKNTVARFSEVPTARRQRGVDVARSILNENGLSGVGLEMVEGQLSDHYDPASRTVRLSPEVYQGSSVASVAIAAHECGHAVQHAKGYFPVVLRSSMAPMVGLGSSIGPWLIMIALGLGATSHLGNASFALTMAWVGVILYGLAVAFHLVTLPVEIDASHRALKILNTHAYLDSQEMTGARKVLTAAAFTYIATAMYALMELLYWVMRLMGSSSRRND